MFNSKKSTKNSTPQNSLLPNAQRQQAPIQQQVPMQQVPSYAQRQQAPIQQQIQHPHSQFQQLPPYAQTQMPIHTSNRLSNHFHAQHYQQDFIPNQLDAELVKWKMVEDEIRITNDKSKDPNEPMKSFDIKDCVSVNFALEHQPIYHTKESQKRGMMVSVAETIMGAVDGDTCRADVVCIIDVSGSMHGEKLLNVKKTLESLLDMLVGSRIAIVVFDSEAEVMMNFKTVNSDNVPKIKKVIDHLHELNSTNITAGVKTSQQLVGNRKTKNSVCSMFLLSDGQHNQGPISNELLFNGDFSITKAEYTLHSFGYGDDHDAKLMQGMSERKGGNYYYVNDISKVDECFVDCLGMITTTLATKAKLRLKLVPTPYYPEIRILKTYGSYWTKESDTEATINLHAIYAGIKKNYLLDVELDGAKHLVTAATQGIIASIQIECVDISTSAVVKIVKEFQTTFVPKGSTPQVNNLEVLKNIVRVRGGEAMDVAETFRRSGQQKQAVELLENFLIELVKEKDIQNDDVIVSLKEQVTKIIEMIKNDMNGIRNVYKTENYMMQNKNMFLNEQSAPLYNAKAMYQNSKQSSNVRMAQSKKM